MVRADADPRRSLIACAGALDLRARVADAVPTRRDDPPGVAAVLLPSPDRSERLRPAFSPRLEQVDAGRLERLERWLKAVARHAPGEDDESLEQTASFTNTHLKELWLDVNVLIQTMRGHAGDRFSVRGEGQKTSPTLVRLTKPQVRRLWVLACAADGRLLENPCQATHAADELDAELRQLSILVRAARSRGDDNYIIRRGALLHGDVPMLAPASMVASDPGPVSVGERYRWRSPTAVRSTSARRGALGDRADAARLRQAARARPSRAAARFDGRAWYRATAAWMQWRGGPRRRPSCQRARAVPR